MKSNLETEVEALRDELIATRRTKEEAYQQFLGNANELLRQDSRYLELVDTLKSPQVVGALEYIWHKVWKVTEKVEEPSRGLFTKKQKYINKEKPFKPNVLLPEVSPLELHYSREVSVDTSIRTTHRSLQQVLTRMRPLSPDGIFTTEELQAAVTQSLITGGVIGISGNIIDEGGYAIETMSPSDPYATSYSYEAPKRLNIVVNLDPQTDRFVFHHDIGNGQYDGQHQELWRSRLINSQYPYPYFDNIDSLLNDLANRSPYIYGVGEGAYEEMAELRGKRISDWQNNKYAIEKLGLHWTADVLLK